jgi:hypothetical protein
MAQNYLARAQLIPLRVLDDRSRMQALFPLGHGRLFRMDVLSEPTLGVLIEGGQHLTGSHLKTLLLKAGIFYEDTRDSDKQQLIRWRLLRARDEARDGDGTAARGLLTFATELVQRTVPNPGDPPSWFDELQHAFLADGYELTWEGEPPGTIGDGWAAFTTPGTVRYKILPTDAAPVPLAREISALEAELAARGYTSVLNHYQQAVDGFTNHKHESANGDLRAALEDLVTRLAEDHTGYRRQPQAGQGGAAISHMIQSGHLPDDDGGLLLRGLWKLSHTNGPHPGQSDADEARFRMQVITATARFLLRHFPAAA